MMPLDPAANQMIDAQVPAWVRLAVAARLQANTEPLAILYAPYDPSPQSPNQRRHWAEKWRDKESIQIAALWAYRSANCPQISEGVDVETLTFRTREMDDDNLVAGVKPLRDELVRLGLLPNDEPRAWKNVGVFQFSHKTYRPAWLVLILLSRASGGRKAGAGDE